MAKYLDSAGVTRLVTKLKTDVIPSVKVNAAKAADTVPASGITGVIDISHIPQGALERVVTVADDTARYKLTTSQVQLGDTVKVTGKSVGKGYQGRMRRWNFAGSKDTHGCEKVHRNNGSIGNNTFPGHVFKGRKMAGHWGAEQVTVQGLEIVDVRTEDNVILIRGSVPGPKNGLVLVRKQ